MICCGCHMNSMKPQFTFMWYKSLTTGRMFTVCLEDPGRMFANTHNYMYIYISVSLSLYIYIYRERGTHLSLSLYIYIYIHVCVYTCVYTYIRTYTYTFILSGWSGNCSRIEPIHSRKFQVIAGRAPQE